MSNGNGRTAALHSLGCKVNAYETEAMQQSLREAGYTIVPFSEKADLYVINTCTVTNIADKKSRQMIHRAKRMNPDAVVVAAGCYVQTAPEKAEPDDAVDIILGNNEKKNLVAVLEEYFCRKDSKKTIRLIDINESGQPYEELSSNCPTEHTRAFVKVQDGCNQFCSYCIVPFARGRARSRAPESVASEVKSLADNGFLEIVLTGINLSSYGTDIGSSLLDLIRLVHAVPGVKRIRLSSLEPGIISEEFVAALAGMEKVCPHFHLSLQSGSDSVLRRMNRNYSTREYLEKCGVIRRYYEHPALTTDVIVGFPGETEEEFAQTCTFVRQAALYEIHVFKYSPREGTAAARMDGQVPGNVKAKRSAQLLQISDELKMQFEHWYEGRRVDVLFEEPAAVGGKHGYTGFTPEYVRVFCPAEESLRNRIMMVEFFG